MKEIKFRVFNGSTMEYNITAGKFGVFYVSPGAKGDGLDPKDTASLTPFTTIYSNQNPVMQFTGMFDMNGKEIWEGDIIRNHKDPRLGVVEYDDAYAGFYIMLNDILGDMLAARIKGEIEVIGNKYENPELLGESARPK